jgi:hypothetical protein
MNNILKMIYMELIGELGAIPLVAIIHRPFAGAEKNGGLEA